MRTTLVALLCVAVASGQNPPDAATRAKIVAAEAKLAAAPGGYDYGLHNELRHLYGGVDEAKSMRHVDAILTRQPFDGYMKQVLNGNDPDKAKAAAALADVAAKHPGLPNLAATCLTWAGDLETDPAKAATRYQAALAVTGVGRELREAIEDRSRLGAARKPWPAKIPAPRGMEKSPGPWSDPTDLTRWPNTTSRANSDPWLAANHDTIKLMKPRLLLVNFSNEHGTDHLDRLGKRIIAALAESTRYHGYANARAPAFLQYEVFKTVDLRDTDRNVGNSRKIPVKDPAARRGFNMKYRDYFSDEFAAHYAVPDPRDPKRMLRLDELLDGGYVHEVWFFESGRGKADVHVGSFEVVEEKPKYGADFKKLGSEWAQAGNGGDDGQPWTGRSCRIGCVNASRGPGCFLESLAHGMEGTANAGVIPYFSTYFKEYADFNLDARYGLPVSDLYGLDFGGKDVRYPTTKSAVFPHAGREIKVDNYVPVGGSAHFPPNARHHYDLGNDQPVLCTMQDWRTGSGPGGKDKAEPYTRAKIRNYVDLAPDCMGAWLVYWRQNMPGVGNKQKADGGKPMKNWWPFLFY